MPILVRNVKHEKSDAKYPAIHFSFFAFRDYFRIFCNKCIACLTELHCVTSVHNTTISHNHAAWVLYGCLLAHPQCNLGAWHSFGVTTKYLNWLERADVTMLHTDVALLQLQYTRPHWFAAVLHYCVTLHVCTHPKSLVGIHSVVTEFLVPKLVEHF